MDMSAGQSTLRQPLKRSWVRKLFAELQGNYGTRFLDMWRSGQADTNGDDVGLQNAMALWAEKLAGFRERPDAIRRVLDTLPKHPPTLPEFVELCRQSCPKPDHKALPAPDVPPAVIAARQAEAEAIAAKVAANVPSKAWAHKLRSRYLSGERLMMAQVALASDALGETWTDEDGQRACRPKLELESAA
jgi:hypothetical protein